MWFNPKMIKSITGKMPTRNNFVGGELWSTTKGRGV